MLNRCGQCSACVIVQEARYAAVSDFTLINLVATAKANPCLGPVNKELEDNGETIRQKSSYASC